MAYVSRLGRNAKASLSAVDQISAAGALVYFADERLHTADEQQWEPFAREVIESEAYRRRLSRTMKRTYASRWERRGLPAGPPPYGFTREWQHHPAEAAIVRAIFERYAEGGISLTRLAEEYGLAEEHVKVMVRNPAYAGLAQHNGKLDAAHRLPGHVGARRGAPS